MDTTQFLTALFAIVVIDLVLAGDNAIVIALAARALPPHLRKRAIVWGAVGAVAVRSSDDGDRRLAAEGTGAAGRRRRGAGLDRLSAAAARCRQGRVAWPGGDHVLGRDAHDRDRRCRDGSRQRAGGCRGGAWQLPAGGRRARHQRADRGVGQHDRAEAGRPLSRRRLFRRCGAAVDGGPHDRQRTAAARMAAERAGAGRSELSDHPARPVDRLSAEPSSARVAHPCETRPRSSCRRPWGTVRSSHRFRRSSMASPSRTPVCGEWKRLEAKEISRC